MTYNVFSGTLNPTQSINQRLLPNLNAFVTASKGMRAVKLGFNKFLQFLTGCAS